MATAAKFNLSAASVYDRTVASADGAHSTKDSLRMSTCNA